MIIPIAALQKSVGSVESSSIVLSKYGIQLGSHWRSLADKRRSICEATFAKVIDPITVAIRQQISEFKTLHFPLVIKLRSLMQSSVSSSLAALARVPAYAISFEDVLRRQDHGSPQI